MAEKFYTKSSLKGAWTTRERSEADPTEAGQGTATAGSGVSATLAAPREDPGTAGAHLKNTIGGGLVVIVRADRLPTPAIPLLQGVLAPTAGLRTKREAAHGERTGAGLRAETATGEREAIPAQRPHLSRPAAPRFRARVASELLINWQL